MNCISRLHFSGPKLLLIQEKWILFVLFFFPLNVVIYYILTLWAVVTCLLAKCDILNHTELSIC